MAPIDLKKAYKTINTDSFPHKMEITLYDEHGRQTLHYEKALWNIEGEERGLRYGENPEQEAAMYRLINGNLTLGEVTSLKPGMHLASDVELLQSGKHPGKTNITDADAALNILRYFQDRPAVAIIKHNNPCGVALGATISEAYHKAYMADRVAAFGGCVALNRELDIETTEMLLEGYLEVVVAPSYAPGVLEMFQKKPNIRIMQIGNMQRLGQYVGQRVVDFKSLIDGGLILQWSFNPIALRANDFLTAEIQHKGVNYKVNRQPTEMEAKDLLFGWLVEAGVTSNSVLYVKNETTVGIGTGEQDRVGVAEIARDKAYRKLADRYSWEGHKCPFNSLSNNDAKQGIWQQVVTEKGGLPGSAMVSDAFFPFRDGIDVGLKEGVTSVVQPGGSIRDFEVIEACNEFNAAMVFTGQRSFRH